MRADTAEGSGTPRSVVRSEAISCWVASRDEAAEKDSALDEPSGQLTVRRAREYDARALAVAMAVTREVVLRRFAAGQIAHVVEVGGQIVSYCWLSVAPVEIGELERTICVPSGDAYVWNCATLPEHRGRGYYPLILRRVAEAYLARGFARVWVCASVTNRASLRGFVKAGFRPVATALYRRVLGWRRLRLVAAPGAPATLVEALRAALGLEPSECGRPGPPDIGERPAA